MEFLQKAQKDLAVAEEMVKNRMAKTVDEALEMMQNQKSDFEQGKIMEGENKTIEEESKEEVKEEPKNEEIKADIPEDRVAKIEQVLEDFGKFFVDYKDETSKKIVEVSEQIAQFREELLEVRAEIQKSKQAQSVERVETVKEAPQVETKEDSSHPKQGEFTSKDVEVENIFSNAHGRLNKR